MKVILFPLCLLGLLSTTAVHAEIYKCTDGSGVATFTDNPRSFGRKQCVSMNLEPVMTISAPERRERPSGSRPSSSSSTPRYTPPSPANFPRVDSATQHKRDQTRRQVLEDEMAMEQRLLTESQRALEAAQRTPVSPERMAQLRNEVTAHQKNIEALQKELQRVR